MAQQELEPVHQLPVLRNAAKLADSLVGIQEPVRQPIFVSGRGLRERDHPALHCLFIGLPGSIEQRFRNQFGQDDVASFGPLTAECGLFGRQGLNFAGPIVAIEPRLRAGVRKVLDAVRGEPGEIHWLLGDPRPGDGAQNGVQQWHFFEAIAFGQPPRLP